MNERLSRHAKLSTKLSYLSDEQMLQILSNSPFGKAWSRKQIIEIDGNALFVKRIPVTALELKNMYSVRNTYEIPCYYNYGIGSAGFGAFRELAVQIKTTNWVISGEIENFPLLHHYRILPKSMDSSLQQGMSEEELVNYFSYWNKSKPIEKYIRERIAATFELVLYIEYIAYPLGAWLTENRNQLGPSIRKILKIIDFLYQNNVIHFDTQTSNFLTDGSNIYLCDYGLALDEKFELRANERRFFTKHRYHDYGQALACIGGAAFLYYSELNDNEKARVHSELGNKTRDVLSFVDVLSKNVAWLQDKKLIKFDSEYLELHGHYKPIITLMRNFFANQRKSKRKNTQFPQLELKKHLADLRITNTN